MFRNNRIYLIFTALIFISLVTLQHYSPKPIDWTITCNAASKSPYGCYVVNDLLQTLFPKQEIETNETNFFVSLDTNNVEHQNLIVIAPTFAPDKYDLHALMKFIKNGNTLFVSATHFDDSFLGTLHLHEEHPIIDTSVFKPGKEVLYLENTTLKNDSGFHFDRKMPLTYISSFDTLNSLLLGTDRSHNANFICIPYGQGRVYLHTQPLAFTNYHLLYGNIEYASVALSCLPVQKTIWDNYYKPDRFVNTSPTRYILSQAPLRTAYYVLLLSLLLYLIVESKRRQRIIPVITPPENHSLQFVKTVGSLYFKQHNNANLAKKKIIYFKEFLRERYYITTLSASTKCVNHVASKSGVPEKQIKQLLESAQYYEKAPSVTDGGLIELNQRLELFYEQCL